MWVAKIHGGIESLKLLVRVMGIILRLLERPRAHIWRAGKVRAEELMRRFEERGVFRWAPNVRGWLGEKPYIFCLGLNEIFGP